MSQKPIPEETANWQRHLASQANNRAWSLSELRVRTPEEDEEMLQAAHTAMYLRTAVGDGKTQAHTAQLVAHVYKLFDAFAVNGIIRIDYETQVSFGRP